MIFSWAEHQFDVPSDKIYRLPRRVVEVVRYGFRLMIAVDSGNWIVLENDIQKNIFDELNGGLAVSEVLSRHSDHVEDVHYVVAKLEGRHFEFEYIPEDYERNFSLRIYLTNNCNLRCRHCFMYADKSFENELTPNEIRELILNCQHNGAEKLILTGGEVLMAPSFKTAIETAKSVGMHTQILSNGTLWTERLIEECSPFIDEIQISIDGFDEQSNSEIRGKGTFEKSLAAVDSFIERGVFTSIVMTPLYDHVEKFYDEYLRFGRALVDKYPSDKFLLLFTDELLDGRQIKSVRDKNARYKKTIAALANEIYANNELTAFTLDHQYNKIFRNCGYGNLTVDSVGDFYFCGRVFDVRKYGNIRSTPFEEVMRLRRRARALSQIDNVSGCADCELKYVCGGGCRISNFPSLVEISDLDNYTPETMSARTCDREHKEKLYALMINADDFLMWQRR